MGQGTGEKLGGLRKKISTRRGAPKIVLPDKGGALKKHKHVFKSFILSDYPYQKT